MGDVLICIIAGLGAGTIIGLAGLSAAVVITPLLVALAGMPAYDAIAIALSADTLGSALSARIYARNGNVDLQGNYPMLISAAVFTVVGSYLGFLFSDANPYGLGYLTMVGTALLGLKFIIWPLTGGTSEAPEGGQGHRRRVLAVVFCGVIGLVCGFTGVGGGMLILMVLAFLLGYGLKGAIGTSTLVMVVVAASGAVSHYLLGSAFDPLLLGVCVGCTLLSSAVAARYANRCEPRRLNRVVGGVLLVLGVVTLIVKLLS